MLTQLQNTKCAAELSDTSGVHGICVATISPTRLRQEQHSNFPRTPFAKPCPNKHAKARHHHSSHQEVKTSVCPGTSIPWVFRAGTSCSLHKLHMLFMRTSGSSHSAPAFPGLRSLASREAPLLRPILVKENLQVGSRQNLQISCNHMTGARQTMAVRSRPGPHARCCVACVQNGIIAGQNRFRLFGCLSRIS